MTLQQLFTQFRIEAFDNAAPYLFTDPELVMWFNEAQIEAAIRKELIRESESIALTQIDVRTGVRSYPLDPRMTNIVYGHYYNKGAMTNMPWPLALTTAADMDTMYYGWRLLPNRPSGLIQYDNTVEVNCLPNADYTVHIEGYRLPVATLGVETDAEVLATGSVTLTGGTDGTVTAVSVGGPDVLGGAVVFNGTLAQTATDVAAQINRNQNKWTASAVGAVVTLTDLVWTGSMHNGAAVAATTTGTLTTTVTAVSGGVDAVVATPEINGVHHRHLVKWVLHRAYEKPDAETFDPAKSARALAQFEDYFGQRPDADERRRQYASTPHHTVSYA